MSSIVTYDNIRVNLADRRRHATSPHPPPPTLSSTVPTDDRTPMAFAITRHISRPVGEVFAFLEDFTNVPTWNYWVREVRQVTNGPIGVGAVFHQVRRDDQQRYRIATHQAPRELVVATIGGSRPAFTRTMILRPAREGTTSLLDRWELDTGHPRALQRMAVHRIRDGIATNLDNLAELLGTGRTVLPDGRLAQTAPKPRLAARERAGPPHARDAAGNR